MTQTKTFEFLYSRERKFVFPIPAEIN